VAKLEREETALIEALVRRASLSSREATLAVVMATRSHARPRAQLVKILNQYPGLEASTAVEDAIRRLEDRGWVVESKLDDIILLHQAPDLRRIIAAALDDPTLEARLSRIRAGLEPSITIVGPMKDGDVYRTFLQALRRADREICLPMLVTPPYDETVQVLQERATAGVSIRLLVGTPRLTGELRGRPMEQVARNRLREWQSLVYLHPTMELRTTDSAASMRLATCVLIDGRLVRFDIYDPIVQRSLEGVMIEVESPSGVNLNFVSLVYEMFDEAWAAARPLGRFAVARWHLSRHWKVEVGLLMTAVAALPIPFAVVREISLGVAAALLGEALIGTRQRWPHWLGGARGQE
jgi:hypothetical protein